MDIQAEEREKIIQRISSNIQYAMEEKGISQGDLINIIKEKRGYKISQPYISRIINGNVKNIPALVVVTICEALDIDIQKVFWENMNSSAILDKKHEEKESKLVHVSRENEFEKYLGKYYCYFNPTISSETQNGILYGELEFKLHPHTKECDAFLVLHINSSDGKQRKEYKGKLILSSSYNCCYCYLANEHFGEISFLIFEGFSSNLNKLSCRMAEVLTPSAGGTRDATCHRMFLSRRKLSEKGISVIKPHLKMNSAEIVISEKNLQELFDELSVPDKFRNTIKALTEPEKFYILREEHFWGFNRHNMEDYDKKKFITSLREKSYAKNYYKIGKKVDEMLYNYIYKAKNSKEFFLP